LVEGEAFHHLANVLRDVFLHRLAVVRRVFVVGRSTHPLTKRTTQFDLGDFMREGAFLRVLAGFLGELLFKPCTWWTCKPAVRAGRRQHGMLRHSISLAACMSSGYLSSDRSDSLATPNCASSSLTCSCL